MLITTALTLQLLFGTAVSGDVNCELKDPPADAGETQAHGVILYIYPRSLDIDISYSGCQNQWFYDDDHFRKLSIVHYTRGIADRYDNINLNGETGYSCQYMKQALSKNNDKRCPNAGRLKKKTYRSGCYSKSKLNASDSYEVAFDDCQLR